MNNIFAVLSKLLRVAKCLKVISTLRVENFELLKAGKAAVPSFYTFEQYAALVAAAERLDPRILIAVLRAGELMGVDQSE